MMRTDRLKTLDEVSLDGVWMRERSAYDIA